MAKHPPDSIRDTRRLGVFYMNDEAIDHYGPIVGAIGIAVYAAIVRHANSNAQSRPAYQLIADSLALSRTTVIATVRKLVEKGLITIEQQTDEAGNPIAANIYTVCHISQKYAAPQHGGGTADEPGGVQQMNPPVQELYPGGTAGVYIGHDPLVSRELDPPPPTMGGVGGKKRSKDKPTDTERFLIEQGMYASNAAEFRDLDLTATQKAYKKARDQGSGNGAIVDSWRVSPPRPAPPAAATNGHRPTAPPDPVLPQAQTIKDILASRPARKAAT
jgi:hypothetical protein